MSARTILVNGLEYSESQFRDCLLAFWKQHAPEKVAKLDVVLQRYNGTEQKMVSILERKYADTFPQPQMQHLESPDGSGTSTQFSVAPTRGKGRPKGNKRQSKKGMTKLERMQAKARAAKEQMERQRLEREQYRERITVQSSSTQPVSPSLPTPETTGTFANIEKQVREQYHAAQSETVDMSRRARSRTPPRRAATNRGRNRSRSRSDSHDRRGVRRRSPAGARRPTDGSLASSSHVGEGGSGLHDTKLRTQCDAILNLAVAPTAYKTRSSLVQAPIAFLNVNDMNRVGLKAGDGAVIAVNFHPGDCDSASPPACWQVLAGAVDMFYSECWPAQTAVERGTIRLGTLAFDQLQALATAHHERMEGEESFGSPDQRQTPKTQIHGNLSPASAQSQKPQRFRFSPQKSPPRTPSTPNSRDISGQVTGVSVVLHALPSFSGAAPPSTCNGVVIQPASCVSLSMPDQSFTRISAQRTGKPTIPTSFLLYVRQKLVSRGNMIVPHTRFVMTWCGDDITLEVSSVASNEDATAKTNDQLIVFRIVPGTEVKIISDSTARESAGTSHSTPASEDGSSAAHENSQIETPSMARPRLLGGLDQQYKTVREILEVPLRSPEIFQRFGVAPPRGVLLHGPPGTGKTLLAKTLARDMNCSFLTLDVSDIVQATAAGSAPESGTMFLQSFFQRAADCAPCVVFIDEMDALCAQTGPDGSGARASSARLLSSLLTCIDRIADQRPSPRDRVMLLGATNRRYALSASVRRPGRFDREIEIGVPNPAARRQILCNLLRRTIATSQQPEAWDQRQARMEALAPTIDYIVKQTHGFVGADLQALCRTASLLALERWQMSHAANPADSSSESVAASITSLQLSEEDLVEATKRTRPSALRAFYLEVPNVKWSDIGGQEEAKQQIREAVEWPLQHPEAFVRLHIRPPKGILLYGPPGCSKTLMAKALATESTMNFIAIKGPELFSKWVGESEQVNGRRSHLHFPLFCSSM